MVATNNPVEGTHTQGPPPAVSTKTYTIAGILTTVYGLDELPSQLTSLACLWLLHPRLQTQACMAPIASQAITAWNGRLRTGTAGAGSGQGLIAVSFDQRNHGGRLVNGVANGAWREGNTRHAPDMFSIYHGTALDTSQLLSYLPAYLPTSLPITANVALGVSLGGHSTWHCILHEPRITAGVVVIGCPDYTSLMQQRAEKSKLESWKGTDPPGKEFIGSSDFPQALVEAVAKWDPAGLLMRGISNPDAPTAAEKQKLQSQLHSHLKGKKILNVAGADDKLVPYAQGEKFLDFLKRCIEQDQDLGLSLEDHVYAGAGHEFTPAMAQRSTEFICEVLSGENSPATIGSKI
ncbi:alpha/beta-hydrolase [Saccharata proteae CBS 121410]|uniref:Alpha/beta-hydrolase n=1 Tax=Saccharata proteae CBS 121410 TaxID=1314787 RepID=A0A6A5YC84_9PEZI|nr:alpha/beta-hydrolase [Saccharata proteae CBS 121410]